MYDRFGYPGLFAAYDAGQARYELGSNQNAHYPPRRVITLVWSQGAIDPPKRRFTAAKGRMVIEARGAVSERPDLLFALQASR